LKYGHVVNLGGRAVKLAVKQAVKQEKGQGGETGEM